MVEEEMRNLKEWIYDILDEIRVLSDVNFQKDCWIDGNCGGRFSFFEEEMCYFFEDYAVEDFLQNYAKKLQLNDSQYFLLKKFTDMLDIYSDKIMSKCAPFEAVDPKEVISDPEWHKVVRCAQEVLKAFEGYEVPKE